MSGERSPMRKLPGAAASFDPEALPFLLTDEQVADEQRYQQDLWRHTGGRAGTPPTPEVRALVRCWTHGERRHAAEVEYRERGLRVVFYPEGGELPTREMAYEAAEAEFRRALRERLGAACTFVFERL